jgi:hypothetical protein
MIAVNWDDLRESNTGGSGAVWWYYNSTNNTFIVEWDSVSYYNTSTVRDKFQVILYDSTYSTSTGDNIILVQYMTANLYTSSTIGIEDPTETIGIQYLFDSSYHPAAAVIQPGRAIKYTTQSPTGIEMSNAQFPISNIQPLIKVHPNPFRGQTIIQLTAPIEIGKSLKIYNSSGRLLKTFSNSNNQSLKTNNYFVWDGKDELGNKVGSGIYFITAENTSKPQKVVYLH